MNDDVMTEYADFVDESVIEKYMSFEKKLSTKLSPWKSWYTKALTAACACVVVVGVLAVTITNYFNSYVKLNDLNSVAHLNGSPSISGVLSPYPEESKYKEMTLDEIKAFLHQDPHKVVDGNSKSIKGEVISFLDGEVHTVRITWNFDDSFVMLIIDPKEHPEFVFNNVDTEMINEYEVGVIYYGDTIVNEQVINDSICIGLKQGTTGVLIYAPTKSEKEAEKIFNHIIDMRIDWSMLK